MDNPLNAEEFYYPFELAKDTREWKNATHKHDNTEETAKIRDFIEKNQYIKKDSFEYMLF